jgi:hypothetical protein
MQTDRVRPRTERWLVPLSETAAVSRYQAPRQAELTAYLAAHGPTPMADLRGRFTSLAALARALEEKGLVRIEEREIYRDALGRAPVTERRRLPDAAQSKPPAA